jgi:hypothetical protein
MHIPVEPKPQKVRTISPSLYEELLKCPARAIWYAHGARGALASHPSALLGVCFHAVMEGLQKARIVGSEDERREGARRLFDELATQIHADAHPLLRVKFPSPHKLPFYYLLRERAAAAAAEYVQIEESVEQRGANMSAISEGRFASTDGVIVGRPDLLKPADEEVVDYKTGLISSDGRQVSDREARQLRLYVYLAGEAGVAARKGTIVRGDGQTASVEITRESAEAEAERARDLLAELNSLIDGGSSFYELARPSATSCRLCPCIPLCDKFWEAADSTWADESGIHLEGTVKAVHPATVQGTALLSLEVAVARGTIGEGTTTLEQLPARWAVADGDRLPEAGDVVRLVDARLVSEDPSIVRADRIMTTLWRTSAQDVSADAEALG